jgi:hypothetical protein
LSRHRKERRIAPYLRGVARETKARELAHRIVLGGQAPLEAAAELGLTRNQLYKLLEGEPYKRESAALFAIVGPEQEAVAIEASRRLWRYVPRAIERTGEILENNDEPAVALRAANSILNRTGFQPPSKDIGQGLTFVIAPERLELLLDAFRVAGIDNVITVDGGDAKPK